MTTCSSAPASFLSTRASAALYTGALLGPSLLLLPGLATRIAGPASILAWAGMLALSGLLAWIFTALGTRFTGGGGVVEYTAAGLGSAAGRAVGWCFLAGVTFGAPVVCLIGGNYVAALVSGDSSVSVAAAAVLLTLVITVTMAGARTSTTLQLGLVAMLVILVVVAVTGSLPAAEATHWVPFAPHGWLAIGDAAAALMLSFVGWEAIAPMTGRLRDPRQQLPRIITVAFGITATVYLGLAAATVAVLGPKAGSAVPLADLLRVAVGAAGPLVATVAALVLTLAATNAYISGAMIMAADLRSSTRSRSGRGRDRKLQAGIAGMGIILLSLVQAGVVTPAQLVAIPTTLFVSVYLGCTAAAVRILTGPVRVAAAAACAVVVGVLAFSGWALLVVLAVVLASRGSFRRA